MIAHLISHFLIVWVPFRFSASGTIKIVQAFSVEIVHSVLIASNKHISVGRTLHMRMGATPTATQVTAITVSRKQRLISHQFFFWSPIFTL